MRVEKDARLRKLVRGTNPEWLFFDCRVGSIMQVGGFWILDRKKISLNNIGEDVETYLEFLSHVTLLELNTTIPLKLANILPSIPNIGTLSIRGETVCCDEDLALLATFSNIRSFETEIAYSSAISYTALTKFLEVTRLKQMRLGNFRGTRKPLVGALYGAPNIERFDFRQNVVTVHRNDGNVIVVDFGKCLP